MDYLTIHTSLSPIRIGFAPGIVNYEKWYTRLTVASEKVYQLLAHGRWFSLGNPASSTTKTGRRDIAESGVKTPKSNQIIKYCTEIGEEKYSWSTIFDCHWDVLRIE